MKKTEALEQVAELTYNVIGWGSLALVVLAGIASRLPLPRDETFTPLTWHGFLEEWSTYLMAGGFAFCVAPLVPCVVAAYDPKGDEEVRTHKLVYVQGGGTIRNAEAREAYEHEHGAGSWKQGVELFRKVLMVLGVMIAVIGPLGLKYVSSLAEKPDAWWGLLITSAVSGGYSFLLHIGSLRAFFTFGRAYRSWNDTEAKFGLAAVLTLGAMWLTCMYLVIRAFFPASWFGPTEEYFCSGFVIVINLVVFLSVVFAGCVLAVPGATSAVLGPPDE